MRKFFVGTMLLMLCMPVFAQWSHKVPATQIGVSTSSFSRLSGTNVQVVLDYIDDYMLLTSDGYATTLWVQQQYYASSTASTTYSSGTTQTVYNLNVGGTPLMTNNNQVLGQFYGFKATFPTNFTLAITNVANYAQVTNISSETFDISNRFASSSYTAPLVGYYTVGASVAVTGQAAAVRLKYAGTATNYEYISAIAVDLRPVSGSALMYADATSGVFTAELLNTGGSESSVITSMVFHATYQGR